MCRTSENHKIVKLARIVWIVTYFFKAITHFDMRDYEKNPNNEHVFLSVTIQKSQKSRQLEAQTITDIAMNTRRNRKFESLSLYFAFFAFLCEMINGNYL